MTPSECVALTLLISVVCIVGDYFLKKASQADRPFQTYQFVIGTAVFAFTAVGWVVVLPYMKLGAVGVVYGVSTVLLTALLGGLAFGERLRWQEGLGVALGVASIVLLARFAE
jgi:drug/metabolite transporter (DMT)-like permease